MYLFYENIKKEIDLKDLVQYLKEPLNQLKVLQIKLQECKNQSTENKIEIEELIRETDKIEKILFPELFANYCKLSLEFRNKVMIKESKDSEGNIIHYTSKDLLLKNSAKLIEHIQLLEEKFYKYFSFDFLVNSRIISELGFQENYLDEKHESIVLRNQYQFSKEDSQKMNIDELIKNNKTPLNIEKQEAPKIKIDTIEVKAHGQNLAFAVPRPAIDNNEIEEKILEKKEVIDSEVETRGGISLIELLLVTGFIALALIATMTVFSKVQQKNQQKQEQMAHEINKQTQVVPFENVQTDNSKLLAELAANKEKNGLISDIGSEAYKQTLILSQGIKNWKDVVAKNNIPNQEINYPNLMSSGFILQNGQILASPRDMISNAKAYHIDLVNNKTEIKISNISQYECKYMGMKLSDQMNIKVNNTEMTSDNMKTVCELNNILTLTEK